MSIENLMTRDLLTLDLDGTLYDAKQLIENNNIHHIIIVDDERRIAGLLTDRMLYKHLSPSIGTPNETRSDQILLRKPVHSIMNRNVVTANPKLGLNEAAFKFYKHNVSCLPIVDGKQTPIGIVTWRDIMKVIAAQFMKRKFQLNDEE